MFEEARAILPQLVDWRRAIHRHPEIGFHVHHTAELVARALDDLGIETRLGVGRTGVVGYLGDGSGPVIAVRADMDALPISEENDVEYASQIPGYMHACGHDGHTAMLLGVAKLLAGRHIPGQVRLLFQPSEETTDREGFSGAPRMIQDGALEGVDAVIALHVDGTLDTGHIRLEEGWIGAAVDTFHAHVIGRGGHGAYPHNTLDPIWLATHVLAALYAIPSRRVPPLEPSVVTVGVIQAGTADNVIPDVVRIEGTLRSYSEAVRQDLLHDVENAFKLAGIFGGDYEFDIVRGYPASHNNAQAVGWLREVAGELLGTDHIHDHQRSMGAEDFSYMTQLATGAMFSLGVKRPGDGPRYLHTPDFDLDEEALPLGAAILAETAWRFVHGQWE